MFRPQLQYQGLEERTSDKPAVSATIHAGLQSQIKVRDLGHGDFCAFMFKPHTSFSTRRSMPVYRYLGR